MSGGSASRGSTQKTLPTPISVLGTVVLGTYLLALAATLTIALWQMIPSCDVTTIVVASVSPTQVLMKGGDSLHIAGEGFRRGAWVQIGENKPVQASVISPFEIVAMAPPARAAGRVPVRVTQEGAAIEVAGGVEYVTTLPTAPVVTRLVPVQVSTNGGEQLHILGDRFRIGARVRIDNVDTEPPVVLNASELVIKTPKHATGVVAVEVFHGSEMSPPGPRLQFVDGTPAATATGPSVLLDVGAITPSSGSVDGGDAVTITGSGFASVTRVFFGGVPARSVRVDGSHFVTAVTPSHAAGSVAVLVGTDQLFVSAPGQFSYGCPAPPDRTMVVMVLFAGALGGLVHALRSFYWYVGEGKLLWNWVGMYVVLPWSSAALGFVFYLVIRAGLYQPSAGTSYLLVGLAALVGMFSRQAAEKLKDIGEGIFTKASQGSDQAPPSNAPTSATAPAITAVTPSSGPTMGGTVVTITGTGFAGPSKVRFGPTMSPHVTDVDASTVKAVTPPASALGSVDVGVAGPGKAEVVKANAYTYKASKGGILDVVPNEGSVGGGTTVRITGTQFSEDVSVTFGDRRAAAPTVIGEGTLEVTAPPHLPGLVDIRIDARDDLIAFKAGAFTYKA
jgi:hypothetical protein